MSDKPWLKFYEPHVPEHLDYPQTILPEALARVARDTGKAEGAEADRVS